MLLITLVTVVWGTITFMGQKTLLPGQNMLDYDIIEL